MANELTGKICDVATNVCQSVTIDIINVPVQLSLSQPDFAQSSPFFFASFSSVMAIWFTSYCIGMMINMVKRG